MTALSVVLPADGEGSQLTQALARLHGALAPLACPFEILVVLSAPDTAAETAAAGRARIVTAGAAGYGAALAAGIAAASGTWVLTIDADVLDPGPIVRDLWARRHDGDVLIGSRYVPGGEARMSVVRATLSRTLNAVFGRGLSLGVRDMSSGVRLYRAAILRALGPMPARLDALQAILVKVYAEGWRVVEVPFVYEAAPHGAAHARATRFAADYLRTFWRLWKLRNSIECADYDARAHDSAIPLQRYWQRQRHRHVTELFAGEGPVLDVGCGSSRIISALPAGSVAVDVLLRKLRYARRFRRPLVLGSGFALPFADASFPCVLCSQVIEHVPKESPILAELVRVLRPGGRLVLGTPDYANWEWVVTETLYGFFAPGAYADEHIAHYTRAELIEHFEALGFTHEATRYILRGELILAFRKAGAGGRDPNRDARR
ncbi:MAG TPA: methyltransferase domain-containing protein [Vicinamibacterales bacterium]|nr:methyltransferase domain-containing protein [Vicinamibacterales bacterium]